MKGVGTHKSVTPTVERDSRHRYIITKIWQLTGQVTVVVIAWTWSLYGSCVSRWSYRLPEL